MAIRQQSIKKRVRAVILLASVVVLIVTTAAFVIYEAIAFRAGLVRNLSTLAAVISDNSAAALAFDNQEVAEEILDALQAEPDIVAAALYDRGGRVFARYPSMLEGELPGVQLGYTGHEFREGSLVLFEPVIQEQKPIGTLYLRSSLQGLYDQLWLYGSIVAIVLAGSLGAAYVLSSLLQRRISDPILALTQTAQTVSRHGDYSVRAAKLTEDELGTFTDSFNQMLSEIQKNQRDLAEQAHLLDLSADAIIVRNMDDVILYWNRAAEEMYGWTRAEALGRTKSELLHTVFPEPREQITAHLLR
jgi:PAS domain-containing protein